MAKTHRALGTLQRAHKDAVDETTRLLRERQRIDMELARLQKTVTHLTAAITDVQGSGPSPGISEAAEQVFDLHKGQPLTIRQLVAEMRHLGVESDSQRFGAAVYATLRRSTRFVRRSDRLWQRVADAPAKEVKAWQAVQASFEAQLRKKARRKK